MDSDISYRYGRSVVQNMNKLFVGDLLLRIFDSKEFKDTDKSVKFSDEALFLALGFHGRSFLNQRGKWNCRNFLFESVPGFTNKVFKDFDDKFEIDYLKVSEQLSKEHFFCPAGSDKEEVLYINGGKAKDMFSINAFKDVSKQISEYIHKNRLVRDEREPLFSNMSEVVIRPGEKNLFSKAIQTGDHMDWRKVIKMLEYLEHPKEMPTHISELMIKAGIPLSAAWHGIRSEDHLLILKLANETEGGLDYLGNLENNEEFIAARSVLMIKEGFETFSGGHQIKTERRPML